MASDPRGPFLYQVPSPVLWEFYRVMDGLSDMDWTRFASEVLINQTDVRLAERSRRRTNWVMNQWESRNGRVGELIDLLERLQLLRPRDVILGWTSSLKPSSPSAPPPSPPLPAPPSLPPPSPPPEYDPLPQPLLTPVTQSTLRMSEVYKRGRPLPGPAPPPTGLQSRPQKPQQPPSTVMSWSYEEVHAGTGGFSPVLQVGEGGFGVVYRATLRNTECAVKRIKQDCLMDWALLRESFETEVDKLTKFRHPNIVELLGVSEGGGSVCLIYSFMENRSLEDQLHRECASLSWSQRVSIIEGASKALQFLHSPPGEYKPLIHGDVKSSNILLNRHLEAKLADFGLARFSCHGLAGHLMTQTASFGKTATIRGTLAYLPDEYWRNGELGTAVDVYSFGVVLLEALTGRRALEKDRKSGERYLKDLVEEVEDSPGGSCAKSWRKQLDHRLLSGCTVEPLGYMEMVFVACRCLERQRKKRPTMTKVFDKLHDLHNTLKNTNCSSSSSLPGPPHPFDPAVGALSKQLSRLEPLENTYPSTSLCSSLPTPHPLHSSSSLPSFCSTSSSLTSCSFSGPCEADESRGYSQYNRRSPFRSDGSRSHSGLVPPETCLRPSSVPTEDQYPPPPHDSSSRERIGAGVTAGTTDSISPVGSLRSLSPGLTDGGRSSAEVRGPEESDELDYLSSEHH